MSASMADAKRRLRQQMRQRLTALPTSSFFAEGEAVAARLDAAGLLPAASSSATVAFFASRPHELSTLPLDALLRRRGLRRCLPRILSGTSGPPTLEFVVVDDGVAISDLPLDAFGIPTPTGDVVIALGACDVVVVPGLAFDDGGGRLGYGRGFYDRALKDVDDARVVGILHDAQWVESIPMEAHDRRIPRLVSATRALSHTPPHP
jgi:5-formyltetrahydrofolate cyclo-ligase